MQQEVIYWLFPLDVLTSLGVWICFALSWPVLSVAHTGMTDVPRCAQTCANSACCQTLEVYSHNLEKILWHFFLARCRPVARDTFVAFASITDAGRKWGERSETWPGQGPFVGDLNLSSVFALPVPVRSFSEQTDRNNVCFSLVGGNMKTFIQKQRSLEHQSRVQIYWSICLITISYRQIQTPFDQCVCLLCGYCSAYSPLVE